MFDLPPQMNMFVAFFCKNTRLNGNEFQLYPPKFFFCKAECKVLHIFRYYITIVLDYNVIGLQTLWYFMGESK